jgi:hypothetical protein
MPGLCRLCASSWLARAIGELYLKNPFEVMSQYACLQYGHALHPKKLSIPGILWRNNTLKALHEIQEHVIEQDPALYTTLMYFNPQSFRDTFWDLHGVGLEKSGLYGLSIGDFMTYVLTINSTVGPDLRRIGQGLDVIKGNFKAGLYNFFQEVLVRPFQHGAAEAPTTADEEFITKHVTAHLFSPENAAVTGAEVQAYINEVYAQHRKQTEPAAANLAEVLQPGIRVA